MTAPDECPAPVGAAPETEAAHKKSFAEDYPAFRETPESLDLTSQSAEYHLAVAKTYSKFADEHARILERYAAFAETVPAEVVREHAGTIRHHIGRAGKTLSRLAQAEKDKSALAGSVDTIQGSPGGGP